MKKNKTKRLIVKFFGANWVFTVFVGLLLVQIFTRFSFIDTKSGFGWDQIDNAWAAKNIIVDHKFPLVGMQAKGNTGLYIGPYYYYLIAPIYLITNLDPVALVAIAGLTSIFTFFLVFFLVKDIFNEKIALLALFFQVISSYIIFFDRVQWPVDFIAPLSLLIFYSLYKIVNGNPRYLLLLASAFGFSLHIHFTSIFYVPIILLVVPFFPRTKQTLLYSMISVVIFAFFTIPILIATFFGGSHNPASYVGSTFLGIHLTRILQVAKDGFIEFEGIINMSFIKYAGFLLFPLYLLLLILQSKKRKDMTLFFLSILWILVPWIAFSTYSGEISNYYFSMTRPIVLITLSYLIYRLICYKKVLGVMVTSSILIFYTCINLSQFFAFNVNGLRFYRDDVKHKMAIQLKVKFSQGDPESYFYYILKERYEK